MGRGLAGVCGSGWDPLWGGTVGKNCLDLLALKQGILVHRRLDAGGGESWERVRARVDRGPLVVDHPRQV